MERDSEALREADPALSDWRHGVRVDMTVLVGLFLLFYKYPG